MTDRLRATTESGGVLREDLTAAIASEPGMSVAVAIVRVTLPPGESIVIGGTTGPVFVLVEHGGRFGATPDGMEAECASREAQLIRARSAPPF